MPGNRPVLAGRWYSFGTLVGGEYRR
jgi:hypothetical protein